MTDLRDGRYAVSKKLGEGAQGATLEAVDKKDGRLVAIKRFVVKGARSWKDVELAEREARVLTRLDHRLLPSAFEHFEEDGALYLVMEKVEGETLDKIGTVDEEDVMAFLRDAAEVLDYLHTRTPPVIHRDIKPSNVIRTPDGDYVLVDFGSVRNTLRLDGGSTVVGTFGYMAPEQLQGRAMPATDVYAVGATAMRMLTGIEPENLPHKGLKVDVKKALGGSYAGKRDRSELIGALEAMLEPDPDKRASAIGPLLAKKKDKRRQPSRGRTRDDKPSRRQRKHERREQRLEARRERKERRRQRRQQWSGSRRRHSEIPALVKALAAIWFAVARLAVSLATAVVVPVVLAVLSVVFGPALRRAARQVTKAGERADKALLAMRRRILEPGSASEGDAVAGPRIEQDSIEEQSIDEQARIDPSIIDDAAAEMEAAAAEIEEEIDRATRRRGS